MGIFHRLEAHLRPIRPPIATTVVFLATAVVTSLTFPHPELVAALGRTPAMLAHKEFWRFITPVFINPEGWRQIVVNGLSLLILGFLVEQQFGPLRWLLIYFISALIGEVAGVAWQPHSAGSSVGIVGLLGAYAASLAFSPIPRRRVTSILCVIAAAVVTWLRDIHGPPTLCGFACAYVVLLTAPSRPPGVHTLGRNGRYPPRG